LFVLNAHSRSQHRRIEWVEQITVIAGSSVVLDDANVERHIEASIDRVSPAVPALTTWIVPSRILPELIAFLHDRQPPWRPAAGPSMAHLEYVIDRITRTRRVTATNA